MYIISFFIYNRNNPDSVENPQIGTEAKAVAAISDAGGLKFYFLVGFYIYFAQIGAFSRKIIIFAKARLSISLKY